MSYTPRAATAVFFFLQGLCAATFVARIPELRAQLHLSDPQLGFATSLLACGGLVMLPLAGILVARFGSRRVLPVAAIAHLLLLTYVGQVQSWLGLLAALWGFGMANTAVQISVNAQAVLVERVQGRSMLAQMHGLWSIAGFVGALLGTAALWAHLGRSGHFIAIGTAGLAAALCFARHLAAAPDAQSASAQQFCLSDMLRPEPYLTRLALLCFGTMFCESAMFDWSGVYFSQLIDPNPLWVGLSYSVLMAAMAAGRLIADRFVGTWGVERVLPLGGQLVAIGFAVCAVLPYKAFALVGFALMGLGICAMVPLIMAQTGRTKRTPLGLALAFVSTVGFFGASLGPLFVGLVAGAINLRAAFAGTGLVALGIALCAAKVVQSSGRTALSKWASAH